MMESSSSLETLAATAAPILAQAPNSEVSESVWTAAIRGWRIPPLDGYPLQRLRQSLVKNSLDQDIQTAWSSIGPVGRKNVREQAQAAANAQKRIKYEIALKTHAEHESGVGHGYLFSKVSTAKKPAQIAVSAQEYRKLFAPWISKPRIDDGVRQSGAEENTWDAQSEQFVRELIEASKSEHFLSDSAIARIESNEPSPADEYQKLSTAESCAEFDAALSDVYLQTELAKQAVARAGETTDDASTLGKQIKQVLDDVCLHKGLNSREGDLRPILDSFLDGEKLRAAFVKLATADESAVDDGRLAVHYTRVNNACHHARLDLEELDQPPDAETANWCGQWLDNLPAPSDSDNETEYAAELATTVQPAGTTARTGSDVGSSLPSRSPSRSAHSHSSRISLGSDMTIPS